MPRRWERLSSSPTFCGTSTRICSAAGCICPPMSWPLTGWTGTCWCGVTPTGAPTPGHGAHIEQHTAPRRVYDVARNGIDMLDARSRPCVEAAFTLYSEILDRIENIDFAIFDQRATVGTGRRLQVAGRGLLGAWRARLTHGR